MDNQKVFAMPFPKVYQCLLNKVTRKGRTQQELDKGKSVEKILGQL